MSLFDHLKMRVRALAAAQFAPRGSNEWVANRLLADRSISFGDFSPSHDPSEAVLEWAQQAPNKRLSRRQIGVLETLEIQAGGATDEGRFSFERCRGQAVLGMIDAQKWELCESFILSRKQRIEPLCTAAMCELSYLPLESWPGPNHSILHTIFTHAVQAQTLHILHQRNIEFPINRRAFYYDTLKPSDPNQKEPNAVSENLQRMSRALYKLLDHLDPQVAHSPKWIEIVNRAHDVKVVFSQRQHPEVKQDLQQLSFTLSTLPSRARRQALSEISNNIIPFPRKLTTPPAL